MCFVVFNVRYWMSVCMFRFQIFFFFVEIYSLVVVCGLVVSVDQFCLCGKIFFFVLLNILERSLEKKLVVNKLEFSFEDFVEVLVWVFSFQEDGQWQMWFVCY